MEFIETVDVKSCKWLISQIKEDSDFLSSCVSAGEFDNYKKTGVLKTLFNLIKSGGSAKTKYVK